MRPRVRCCASSTMPANQASQSPISFRWVLAVVVEVSRSADEDATSHEKCPLGLREAFLLA